MTLFIKIHNDVKCRDVLLSETFGIYCFKVFLVKLINFLHKHKLWILFNRKGKVVHTTQKISPYRSIRIHTLLSFNDLLFIPKI